MTSENDKPMYLYCPNCDKKVISFIATLIDYNKSITAKGNMNKKCTECGHLLIEYEYICKKCGKIAEVNIENVWVRYDWDDKEKKWSNQDIYAVDSTECFCNECWNKECEIK